MDAAHAERFWKKVNKNGPAHPTLGTACWLWTGCKNASGYGWCRDLFAPVSNAAHRVSFRLCVGYIPRGLQLDHLCRVRHCVNPAHLEPVTPQENTRRGEAGINYRNKTHCPKGHPYAGDNLYVNPRGDRQCRECQRARAFIHNERRAQRRAAARSS